MPPASAVDVAIDRLDEVLREVGLAVRPPAAVPDLDAVDIGEFAVPAELRRFLERIDPLTPLAAYDGLARLQDVAHFLSMFRESEYDPPHLWALDTFKYGALVVELAVPAVGWDGGAVFSVWERTTLRAASLAQLVHSWCDTIEAGQADRRSDGTLHLPEDGIAQAARLRDEPHPTYGSSWEAPLEREDWPLAWRVADGLVEPEGL